MQMQYLEEFMLVIIIMWGIFLTGAIVVMLIELNYVVQKVEGYHTPDSTDKFNGTYLDSDYCSNDEYGFVEYCIVGLKGIQCDTEAEQIICQQHNRNLEKIGQ